MRVTHQIIKNTVMQNIQRNLTQMSRYQDMLSSGKTIKRPSDDPIKVSRVMGYNSTLQQNEQYRKNIDAAQSWMETTEDALHGMTEVLHRVRELTVAGASDTMSQSARDAIAMEVDELNDALTHLANSSYQGRYIFAGFKTTTVPFTRDKELLLTEPSSVVYHGDSGSIKWEIAPNVTVKGNLDGQNMLMDPRIFEYMDQLVISLRESDQDTINQSIKHIGDSLDYVLDKRAALGAIVHGIEISREKYLAEQLNFTELRSVLQDIDLAETLMNYNMLENVYHASLSTGARIIQPSLLDFLR